MYREAHEFKTVTMKSTILILLTVTALALIMVVAAILKFLRNRKSGEPPASPDFQDGGSAAGMQPQDSVHAQSRQEETIANIYMRLEQYFEAAKPYLDGNLTINDVAARLYTNKVYVSKAVNRYSGLNYCQYVNRYRIGYAVESYKKDPGLRISELAQMSGFNSMAAFNISFRTFMNESPREWCDKVKCSPPADM